MAEICELKHFPEIIHKNFRIHEAFASQSKRARCGYFYVKTAVTFQINLANLFNDKIVGYAICSKPHSAPRNNEMELGLSGTFNL